ncbi:MAG: hypothetical protein AAFR16_09095 [Pseudomonadota bacterium]
MDVISRSVLIVALACGPALGGGALADVPDVLQADGGVVDSYDTPIWDDGADLVAGTGADRAREFMEDRAATLEQDIRGVARPMIERNIGIIDRLTSDLQTARDQARTIGEQDSDRGVYQTFIRTELELDRVIRELGSLRSELTSADFTNLPPDSPAFNHYSFQTRIFDLHASLKGVFSATSTYTGYTLTPTDHSDVRLVPDRDAYFVGGHRNTAETRVQIINFSNTLLDANSVIIDDVRGNLFNREQNAIKPKLYELQRLRRLLEAAPADADAVQCSSPCALGSLGLGLNDMVSRSAFYFAGRSAHAAPIMNAFGPRSQFDWTWINERSQGPISQFDRTWINERSQGPISQFDHTWINERSHGPLSPFDHSWINARSQGPVSQFDHSWINARSYGADDVQSWSQRFPSPNGLPATMPSDAAGGLSETLLAELEGLDARQLFDQESRDAVAELLAAKLVREFDIDPAVGDAVANGTLIAITQALAASPGALLGGGSSGGFSDITLELPLLFRVFDFATVDNDIITLRVTDQNGLQLGPLEITLSGPAAADTFAPDVAAGPIEISITAENTGLFFPNTGEIDVLSNITQGATTQRFNLTTGETGVLSITATPPPSP